jgi:hypothetical protein
MQCLIDSLVEYVSIYGGPRSPVAWVTACPHRMISDNEIQIRSGHCIIIQIRSRPLLPLSGLVHLNMNSTTFVYI